MTLSECDPIHCAWRVARKFQIHAARIIINEPLVKASVAYWPPRDHYPVSVYASFGRWEPQADEVLVISFQVWNKDDRFLASCDFLVDNHIIFAEMTIMEFYGSLNSDEFHQWLALAANTALIWVEDHMPSVYSIIKDHEALLREDDL